MIPADVASRLQVSADAALRPVAPAQEIADKLSGLVAGQKVMAEIQSMLPNGTYRAMINQRNITLALPFSAKSGDALELMVTESDGKLALAVVAPKEGEGGKAATTSTTATLSRTGQLISTLFSGAREAKGGATALPLNSNQPIANAPPSSAQDLLPLLKQAITQSGMFYESHQAEWVEGRLAKSALLQEPQGKLSSPAAFSAALEEQASAALLKTALPGTAEQPPAAPRLAADAKAGEQASATLAKPSLPGAANDPATAPRLATETRTGELANKTASLSNSEPAAALRLVATDMAQSQSTGDASKASATQTLNQVVAPQTQPVVQQQLDALATQNFSWQGQVWPGQEMRWEIDEDAAQRGQDDDDPAAKWTTRLNLALPNLGEISAQIRLQGNQITLTMSADTPEARTLMRSSSMALRSQLDEAGLTLASMGVSAANETKAYGQTEQ